MNAKLKTLKRGQTFFGAGIQWLVLGHTNSSQGLFLYAGCLVGRFIRLSVEVGSFGADQAFSRFVRNL